MKTERTDIFVRYHGTIATLLPDTDRAREWVKENIQVEPWQWSGGALCIEPRYIGAIIEGAINEGLKVAA